MTYNSVHIEIRTTRVKELAKDAIGHRLYTKKGVLLPELINILEGKRSRLVVAYQGEVPIALLFNTGRAMMFYTKRPYRRQGLAKMLWHAFLEKYHRNPKTLLGWSASNASFFPSLGIEDKQGVAFYQALGWEVSKS